MVNKPIVGPSLPQQLIELSFKKLHARASRVGNSSISALVLDRWRRRLDFLVGRGLSRSRVAIFQFAARAGLGLFTNRAMTACA